MNFALIGHPVAHSFSSRYLNDKFESEGIDASYSLLDLTDIAEFRQILASDKYDGFNVTIPYKTAVIPFVDDLSPEAAEVGAVNVIKVNEGRSIGYNTDIIGFESALIPMLKTHHNKALILGTGGASKAVAYVLRKLKIEFAFVSRSKPFLTYGELTPDIIADHSVIINTTPLGMSPNVDTAPDIPYEALTSRHLLFDLVYNPEITRFQSLGMEHGADTCSGLSMLYAQADAAFDIWFNSHLL